MRVSRFQRPSDEARNIIQAHSANPVDALFSVLFCHKGETLGISEMEFSALLALRPPPQSAPPTVRRPRLPKDPFSLRNRRRRCLHFNGSVEEA